jgi:hypothetical protein
LHHEPSTQSDILIISCPKTVGGLQWRARVLNPSAYGDRVDVKHSGGLGFNLTISPRAQPKLVEDRPGDIIAIHPRRLNGKDAAEPH